MQLPTDDEVFGCTVNAECKVARTMQSVHAAMRTVGSETSSCPLE